MTGRALASAKAFTSAQAWSVQPEPPIWISATGTPETFGWAGANGFNVLTMLLGGNIDDVAPKIALYREQRRAAGLDPDGGRVALMLHSFVHADGDFARRTVRGTGLPRFMAVAMLGSFTWLAVAGGIWLVAGPTTSGPRYDALLHAVFLGFVMSMVMAHAPVILPAVLRRPLPYRPVMYAPLALLHASLLVRVGIGDGTGWEPVWRWAGVGNVVAVLGFVACAAAVAVRAARSAKGRRATRTRATSAGLPAGATR